MAEDVEVVEEDGGDVPAGPDPVPGRILHSDHLKGKNGPAG